MGNIVFEEFAEIQGASIAPSVWKIQTNYYAPIVGQDTTQWGGASYKRWGLDDPAWCPSSAKSQDADGYWWVLDEEQPYIEMFGGTPSIEGQHTSFIDGAFKDAIDYLYNRNRSLNGNVGGGGDVRFRSMRYRHSAPLVLKQNTGILGASHGKGPFIGDGKSEGSSLHYWGDADAGVAMIANEGDANDSLGYIPGLRVQNVHLDANLRAGYGVRFLGTQGLEMHRFSVHRATNCSVFVGGRNPSGPGNHHFYIDDFFIASGDDAVGMEIHSVDKSQFPGLGGCAFGHVTNGKITVRFGDGLIHRGGDDSEFDNIHIAAPEDADPALIRLGGGNELTRRACQGNFFKNMHISSGPPGHRPRIVVEGGTIQGDICRAPVANVIELTGVDRTPIVEHGENSFTIVRMTGSAQLKELPYDLSPSTEISNGPYRDGAYLRIRSNGENHGRFETFRDRNGSYAKNPTLPLQNGNVVFEFSHKGMVNTTTDVPSELARETYGFHAATSATSLPMQWELQMTKRGETTLKRVIAADSENLHIDRLLSVKPMTRAEILAINGNMRNGAIVPCSDGDNGQWCIALRTPFGWRFIKTDGVL